MLNTGNVRPVGTLLREWRQRRRLSQLELAAEAEISTRHLSFLETGRALPSRAMLLQLAEQLNVPLRERNLLLVAGGFAPVFPERPLDDPALRAAQNAVERVLAGHEPYPALAIDRHWNMLAANRSVAPLLAGVAAELLQSPVNVLRLSLHPAGLAPRIANLREWRAHLLARLRRQIDLSGDEALAALLKELEAYPVGNRRPAPPAGPAAATDVVVPLRLRTTAGVLEFFSTTMIFGTPVDITVSELAIEAFFPADEMTSAALAGLGQLSRVAQETPDAVSC